MTTPADPTVSSTPHRWMEAPLPGYWIWVLGAGAGRVWLRVSGLTHGDPGTVAALDARTGAGLWTAPLRFTRLSRDAFAIGDGWIAAAEGTPKELSKESIVGFDLETGARLWSREGQLVAAGDERLYLRHGNNELLVLSGADGSQVGELALTAGWRNLAMWGGNALTWDGGLWYLGSSALVRIEDRGGWREVDRIETGETSSARLVRVGERLVVGLTRETDEGSTAVFLATDDQGVFSEAARLPGRLTAMVGGDFLTAWTSLNEKTTQLTAMVPGGPSASVMTTEPAYGARIASDGATAVTELSGGVAVARLRGGALTLTRCGASEGMKTVAVAQGAAWVMADRRRLLRLSLSALPYEPAVDMRYGWWDVPARSFTADYYARVTALAEGSATVEHPELGALTLLGDVSGLKLRDRVTLDEVLEVLPGVHRVRRWRKAHGEAAPFVPPAPLVFPASELPPLPEAPVATVTAHAAALLACAAERGFAVTPLMLRFFERYDADERFRKRVNYVGLYLSIDGYTNCWLGTDCSIVGFAGDMSGQTYGLYLYPPELSPDGPVGIVYWDHESRGVSWRAPDFDGFLANHLASAERWSQEEFGRYVREALGLPPREEVRYAAPEWFEAAHEPSGMSLESALLLAEDDPVAAERALVALHREREKSERIGEALERLYVGLGWEYHRRNLRKALEIAGPYLKR